MRFLRKNMAWVIGGLVLWLLWRNRGVTSNVSGDQMLTPGPVSVPRDYVFGISQVDPTTGLKVW